MDIWIYGYMDILRLRPCRRPLCQQATVDWLTAEMGNFFYKKLSFWWPCGSILGTLSDHFDDPGVQGSPNRHLEVHLCIFIDFGVILGVSWDPLWAPFSDYSVIGGAKMGDSFQVHVFGDPGMEMMPECSVCMCYIHSKNNGFRCISLFPFLH